MSGRISCNQQVVDQRRQTDRPLRLIISPWRHSKLHRFFQTAFAVHLCIEQPERMLLVTKRVYPDVAKQYKTNWKAVERNIRTVSWIVWEQNRSYLEKLAGRELLRKPRNAQLLAILSHCLLSQYPYPLTAYEPGEAVTLPRNDYDTGVVD